MATKFTFSSDNNLSLKYRPKLFKDLIGQDHIVSNLQAMIDTRKIHQSILFFGQSGNGKTSAARVLARYLNCQDLQKDEDGHSFPCGKCDSCTANMENHPDVLELNIAATGGKDDVKMLVRNAQLSPSFNFKIFILDEVHALSGAAKETILKPLEEPPARTVWILCTTNPEKLTPTMRGRCRQLEVKPLDTVTCAKLLNRIAKKEGVDSLSKEQFLTIARLTGAQPRAAIQALGAVLDNIKTIKSSSVEDLAVLIENVVALPPYKAALSYLKALYSGKYKEAMLALESTDDKVPFAKIILEYHYKACRYHIDPSLRSKEYFDKLLYQELDQHKLPLGMMSKIMTRLVSMNSLVREFEVDATFVITAATMEIIESVKAK
jgi:DNA polymerase-3 subunit gamma/tau